MKTVMLSLISACVFFFASSAVAGSYVTGKLGHYSPDEGFLDNGFNIEGAYGFDISTATGIPNTALELGLGYYSADSGRWFNNRDKLELSVVPITATAIYTFDLEGPFSLYGGAGVGLYYAMWELRDRFGVKYDDSELEFGLNLVGGGRLALSQQIDLAAELKYAAVTDNAGGLFLNFGVKYNF